MRVLRAIVWVVALSWIAGIGQEARGGMTIDVVFKDPTVGGAFTFAPGDPEAAGCVGPYGYTVVSSGRCMDVVLKSDFAFVGVKVSVQYDTSNNIQYVQAREWLGIGVSWNFGGKTPVVAEGCYPFGGPGITQPTPGMLRDFDCVVGPPNNPPVAPAGTYYLGTIVWDLSMMGPGHDNVISVVFGSGDAVLPVINGNIILDYSPKAVLGSKILNIIPEPGTAALLGLGIAGLTLAARRRRG